MIWMLASLLTLSAVIYGFAPNAISTNDKEIQWQTMENALVAQQKTGKKLLIDVYTDWCKWCKVMDEKTFTDPELIRYVNENFIPVKFNAEQREAITFKGQTYQYQKGGRRGMHGLAYELMQKNASYPSFVLLDENLAHLKIIKGYKDAPTFLANLQ